MPENKSHKIEILRLTLIGFGIGLVFPFLAWIIEFHFQQLPFSLSTFFSNLIYIHSKNKVILIVDSAPIILSFIFLMLSIYAKKVLSELNSSISRMNFLLDKNSEFAKKIGQGDSFAEFETDSSDSLGQALIRMRDNLIETQKRESKQTWVAKGKELIGDILRFNNKIEDLSYQTLVALVDFTNSVQGAFYLYDEEQNILTNISTYAYNRRKYINKTFRIGQGLIGAAAYEKDLIMRTEIPDDYLTISSGLLGDKKPKTLIIAPLLGDEKLQGVIEIASLNHEIPDEVVSLMQELSNIIGQTVFNLRVNERTEKLLQESREMTYRLRKNEDELRKNAEQMKLTQKELEESNKKLANQIAEVEKARERLYSLLENASEIISIYNQNGVITYESPNIKPILGYTPDEIIGKNGFTVFDEDTNNKFKIAFYNLIENPDKPISFEYVFHKDGEEIWLETIGRNLLSNTAINGIIFNTRDITVRKIAEKAQRMSGQMQALSENSPDMIIRVTIEGAFFYANPIAEEFIKVGKNKLIGKRIDEISLVPTIKETFNTALNTIVQDPIKYETETSFPRDNQEDRIVQFNAIPEFNELNELETVLFVAHDITLQKQIQIEIEQKNKSITESINYARRIQTAILPTESKILQIIPKSFLFYLPRDVVSGDIPWMYTIDDITFIAAIDCTGHGVPGALLSFIGYFLINNIISTKGLELNSGQALDLLHEQVRKTLNQDTPDAEQRDGMDIALCKIDYKNKKLNFAGAHRPLMYQKTDSQEVIQYKGTLKAIGGIPMKNKIEKKFENYEIDFEQNDRIFFFSDGLADQVNPDGEKFKNTRIKNFLEENKNSSIFDLKSRLQKEFMIWKGENKQIDDILFIGVEF